MLKLPKSWKELSQEISKPYFKEIERFLDAETESGKVIYPEKKNIFNALESTGFSDVKVVILGQDPYHGEGQAHGLSFSVPDGIKIPPSLRNMYKELISDIGGMPEKLESGNLSHWAEQGVLLLNSCFTVEASTPASHSKIGWERFSDAIIYQISEKNEGVVFLLWGAFAQSKKVLINEDKHLVLETTHPSPFSAYRGFLGSKPFSQTNTYLEKKGKKTIDWSLGNEQLLF